MLRDYQLDGIDRIAQAIRDGHRSILFQAPTGAGKSHIMAEMIRRAREKGNGVMVTVPKITLVDQMSEHLERIGVPHGVMQADHVLTNPREPVQVASLQTLIKRGPPPVRLVLVDEAHRVYRKMTDLMNRWNRVPFIGFSATPWTKGLGNIYTKLIKPVSIRELIDRGYLVDADIYAPHEPDLTRVRLTGGDYNKKDLGAAMNDRRLVGNIVDTWFKLAEGKQTLVAATNVAHSKQIVETFRMAGVNAAHIDYMTKDEGRDELLDGFKAGDITMLSSVNVLSEGADFPAAECLIIARPTKSRMFHIQIVGRVLRPCDEISKEKAIIIDHAGNFVRNGMHTDDTPDELDTGEKGEPKERIQKEKLPKVCPSCSYIKPAGVSECPQCGFKPERQNEVFEEEGELVQISKAAEKRNRTESWDDKIAFIGGLRRIAEIKGYKPGWADYRYRDRYSVMPNDSRVKYAMPIDPNNDVIAFIKHLQIKNANSNRVSYCKHCKSKNIQQGPGKGPHAASLVCGDCGRHLKWLPKHDNETRQKPEAWRGGCSNV